MKVLDFFQKKLNLFKSIFKKNTINTEKDMDIPPSSFTIEEKISRTIFSPINIRNNGNLKNNAFTTPPGKDEVSVNRLTYTTPDFIKEISKFIENPDDNRNYYGFGILSVGEIYECKSDIEYTPNSIKTSNGEIQNPFHSDIKIGFVKKRGEPLPAEFSYKIDQMVNKARLYKDKNPKSNFWEGEELI